MTKYSVFQLEEWFERYEFEVDHLLGSSSCAGMTMEELCHITGETVDFAGSSLGATPGPGSDELREAISTWYKNGAPENVYITSSSTEAIFLLIESILSQGDSMIAMFPMYPALYQLAEDNGAEIRHWHLRHENSFEPDLDELKELVDDTTKLIVVNNPNNPTGQIMLRDNLQHLAHFSREHNIQLWVDEVFRGITVDGGPVTPSIRDIDSTTISTGSMSKSFGLSGLRVGWIAAPEEVLEAFRHIRFYTTVTAPVIEQRIATVAHRNRDKVIGRNQTILDRNYTYLKQWMGKMNRVFDWVEPKGGPVTFPKFIDSVNTDDFCLKLAEDYSVLVPSGNYSFNAEGFIRIGFGHSSGFEEAMSRVEDALNDLSLIHI